MWRLRITVIEIFRISRVAAVRITVPWRMNRPLNDMCNWKHLKQNNQNIYQPLGVNKEACFPDSVHIPIASLRPKQEQFKLMCKDVENSEAEMKWMGDSKGLALLTCIVLYVKWVSHIQIIESKITGLSLYKAKENYNEERNLREEHTYTCLQWHYWLYRTSL